MSESPIGWTSIRLADAVDLKTGPFGSALHQSDYVTSGVPLVNPMHIVNGLIKPTAETTVTPATAKRLSEYLLREGDLILARRGEMGRSAVVRSNEAGWLCGTGSLIVRPDSRLVDVWFLHYLLGSAESVKYLLEASVGSTMANLNQQHLLSMPVRLPPRAEQTRVVERIEELLSQLEAGVGELHRARQKLGLFRQSLLKAAVEGALTSEWRTKHTTTESGAQLLGRVLNERRTRWEARQIAKFKEQGKAPPKDWQKKYVEPAGPDAKGLPEAPVGWTCATVEQLGHVQLGRQRSPGKVGKANPTPYIRAANITERGVDLSDVLEMDFSKTEKETFALKVGDVLLTEASGSPEHVGRPAIWEREDGLFCFQNTVLRFTPEGIGSKFAFYSFLAMQKLGVFSRLSGGVGINHLSAGKFSRLAVPLPPLLEQGALVDILEESLVS